MKNILKFFLPILFLGSILSCNDRLEGDEIQSVNAAKIDSVKIVNYTMDVYSTQTIKTYSNFSTNCEGFYGYDYLHTDEYEREVISYKFKTDANCGEMTTKAAYINFQPQKVGAYKFRFFSGKNSAGENTWQEETILVN